VFRYPVAELQSKPMFFPAQPKAVKKKGGRRLGVENANPQKPGFIFGHGGT